MSEELPDWLARNEGDVGIVFTDVVDSTALIFDKKTIDYRRTLRAHHAQAADLVRMHDGRLIEEVGDQVVAAFDTARQAMDFGLQFVRATGDPELHIRVGVHHGTVHAEGSNLVGRSMHIAARVMQHGAGGELWASDHAKRQIEAEGTAESPAVSWLTSEDCELKGIPGRLRLWRAT